MIRGRRKQATAIEAALTQALMYMPPDGDLDVMLANLGAGRGREVTLLRQPLPASGPTGAWVATQDKDYIVVTSPVAPSHEVAIIAHEVGHMMLGHSGDHLHEGAEHLAPLVAPHIAARFLARHEYENDQEQDAEAFATLLAAEHARRQQLFRDPVSARLR